MKTNLNTNSRSGMTLVEVIVTVVITSIVLTGTITAVLMGNQVNNANGQQLTAFGLCKEWYEQMRAAEYTNVTTVTFSEEEVRLTHLGGINRLPIYGMRSCTIAETNNPTRKVVNIQVRWTYRNVERVETLDGAIYRRR